MADQGALACAAVSTSSPVLFVQFHNSNADMIILHMSTCGLVSHGLWESRKDMGSAHAMGTEGRGQVSTKSLIMLCLLCPGVQCSIHQDPVAGTPLQRNFRASRGVVVPDLAGPAAFAKASSACGPCCRLDLLDGFQGCSGLFPSWLLDAAGTCFQALALLMFFQRLPHPITTSESGTSRHFLAKSK